MSGHIISKNSEIGLFWYDNNTWDTTIAYRAKSGMAVSKPEMRRAIVKQLTRLKDNIDLILGEFKEEFKKEYKK